MDLITLDMETFYSKEFSLSKISPEEYIRSPQFEVIGVAVKANDGESRWFSGDFDETKAWLQQFDWSNSMVVAHNAAFDCAILAWQFGIRPRVIADTMSMANAIGDGSGSVSLSALAERYQIGKKGTEVVNALGKRRLDFSPDELAAYAGYCINDVELCHTLFTRMLAEGFPKAELKLIDMTLRMFIDPVFELDQGLLEQHLADTVAKREKLLADCGVDRSVLMSNPKFAELLRSFGVEPPMKTSPATGKPTYAFAKTDEAFRALHEQYEPGSVQREVVEVLVAARTGTKSTLEETRTQKFIDIAKRGLLPIPIKYCGAKTKRWSGEGGGINMQNLPRKSPLKAAIRAPAGHAVVGVDLSNIELRIGLWFGGMFGKLEELRGGRDLYKDFAAMAFNVDYSAVDAAMRFVGKTSQLSLVYSVGANKLRQAIKTGSGKDIGEAEAARIVSLYRSAYSGVVDAWRQGERVLESILANNYMEFGPNGVIQVHGRKGLLLPCGLFVSYPDLQKVQEDGKVKWRYRTRKGWEYIYGAKVFQGVIQALARCVIGDGMLRVGKRYPVALTVHDAVYAVTPLNEAQQAMDFIIEQLCIPPAWAPDLPLAAEGGFGATLKDC